MVFRLSDSLMSGHAAGTEVLHAIEAASIGHGLVLTVGALRWVLHSEYIQHVVDEGVAGECIDPFCWDGDFQVAYWADQCSVMVVSEKGKSIKMN